MTAPAHPLVQLARRAIESYIRESKHIAPPPHEEWSAEMSERAGTFVSLHEFGDLRGCIGTLEPTCTNVAEEIIDNAIRSATRDPRFEPVTADELNDLEISVDVLSQPEPIDSLDQLDPEQYGVIVTDLRGIRRGLLLPRLPQVTSAAQQVAIARQKAYLSPNEPIKMYRFQVRRFH